MAKIEENHLKIINMIIKLAENSQKALMHEDPGYYFIRWQKENEKC